MTIFWNNGNEKPIQENFGILDEENINFNPQNENGVNLNLETDVSSGTAEILPEGNKTMSTSTNCL